MRRADVVSGGAAALAGAAAYALTLPFPELADGHPGPALFPRLVAGLMVLFGLVLAWQGARGEPAEAAEGGAATERAGVLNALLVVAAVVGYILVVERAGFVPTLGVLLFALMWRLGVRLGAAVGLAAGLAVGTYLLFARVLLVPLPRGPIPF
ncbi:MAG TPA: tripartite tricarboxylate transporter TctB family protein [Thermodesulfobacteriota bacterium]